MPYKLKQHIALPGYCANLITIKKKGIDGMIRDLEEKDINVCAQLLIEAYNNPHWNCRWTTESASCYLTEFVRNPAFIGFVLEKQSTVIGAMFCHKKTWWTNDEVFIDEFFIKPNYQNNGYGKQILKHAENYCITKGLAGITLATNKYAPARLFYEKQNYTLAEHVIYYYKEI